MATCPAPDCRETLAPDMLACGKHWFGLPYELRRRVQAAWRTWCATDTSAAELAYQKERRKAIEFLQSDRAVPHRVRSQQERRLPLLSPVLVDGASSPAGRRLRR
jgi:hypothetical protein